MNMFFLSVGALVGAPLRYVLGEWFKAKFTERIWPLAMVIVNMLGSFGLGVFATFIFFHEVSSSTQLLIATGFFGYRKGRLSFLVISMCNLFILFTPG